MEHTKYRIGIWIFGMLHFVTGQVIPSVLKDHTVFTFKIRQPKKKLLDFSWTA